MPLVAFENEQEFERMSQAVRLVETMARKGGDILLPDPHGRRPITVRVTDVMDAQGYWPGVMTTRIIFRNQWDPTTTSTSTTSTTTVTPISTTTTTPMPSHTDGEPVWIKELNGSDLKVGCRYNGIILDMVDGRIIVEVNAANTPADCNPTSTTTTTIGPCPGKCSWTWNSSTKVWGRTGGVLDSAFCASPGCSCDEPQFCPNAATPCAVTLTDCTSGIPQKGPNCAGTCSSTTTTTPGSTTTTTTTSTTPPPSCAGCTWKYIPLLGWRRTSKVCNGPTCLDICDAPTTVGSTCVDVSTPCYPTTTTTGRPGCAGNCLFVSDGTGWIYVPGSKTCNGACGSGICDCGVPSEPPAPCATQTYTNCHCPGTTSTTPVFDPTSTTGGPTTTTTKDPCATSTTSAGCTGSCYWKWVLGDGVSTVDRWEFVSRNCGASYPCGCVYPNVNGTTECEIRLTACSQYPTTTTTNPPCSTRICNNYVESCVKINSTTLNVYAQAYCGPVVGMTYAEAVAYSAANPNCICSANSMTVISGDFSVLACDSYPVNQWLGVNASSCRTTTTTPIPPTTTTTAIPCSSNYCVTRVQDCVISWPPGCNFVYYYTYCSTVNNGTVENFSCPTCVQKYPTSRFICGGSSCESLIGTVDSSVLGTCGGTSTTSTTTTTTLGPCYGNCKYTCTSTNVWTLTAPACAGTPPCGCVTPVTTCTVGQVVTTRCTSLGTTSTTTAPTTTTTSGGTTPTTTGS